MTGRRYQCDIDSMNGKETPDRDAGAGKRSYPPTFPLRLPPHIKAAAQAKAEEEGRSLNSYIVRALELALFRRGNDRKGDRS